MSTVQRILGEEVRPNGPKNDLDPYSLSKPVYDEKRDGAGLPGTVNALKTVAFELIRRLGSAYRIYVEHPAYICITPEDKSMDFTLNVGFDYGRLMWDVSHRSGEPIRAHKANLNGHVIEVAGDLPDVTEKSAIGKVVAVIIRLLLGDNHPLVTRSMIAGEIDWTDV